MSDLTSAGTAVGGGPVGGDGPVPNQPATGGKERSASLWADARRQLMRDPVFVIAFLYILVVGSMAAFPWLWTSQDPRDCNTNRSRLSPSAEHLFGTDILGCDYYAHAIYGARPSMVIALMATVAIVVVGGLLGLLAGYHGGWVDTIISRVMDIFFSLPFLLGAIVFLTVIKRQNIWTISLVLFLLAWPTIARIIRGSVISSKDLDYVHAAKAVGARNSRVMFRHILPNAIAPMLVYATIVLGSFVAAEATLTFLGVGLQPPAQSWGIMISAHQVYFLEDPWLLLFPCGLLVGTVLSFILMGDALRDALDPKFR
ncbi:ABC transporter permease [Micromonospora endophytica]|uniref:Peptide ABC transporter permease n=1 Tax=Micromonospora endophytica TaxID=515350 RepID=A0A2W2CH19_9ACTN|nr:ABC transporter permease [Micromonospora endophytica]PZF91028.1 peptide ABC transporter permease [Micromonospora endophytica]RIW43662.1 ABC transporter permease [Micromonospora endophytica]BCJ60278.1 peptide ABC transporter permease [Micromonospora endophytica]